MASTNRQEKTRLERVLSIMRITAILAIAVLLFYRAYGPDRSDPYVVDVATGGDRPATATVPAVEYFADPAAQHLVALGHALVESPTERVHVARELQELTDDPDGFPDDPAVYLSLRAAYWQLRRDPQVSGSFDAAMILWDAAEKLEARQRISAASTAPKPDITTP